MLDGNYCARKWTYASTDIRTHGHTYEKLRDLCHRLEVPPLTLFSAFDAASKVF